MNRSMKFSLFLAALGCMGFANAAEQQAAPKFVSIEEAVEAGSAGVVLPDGPGSALSVTPCGGCTPVLARATANTAYFLRNQRVNLAQFKAAPRTDGRAPSRLRHGQRNR